MLSVEITTYDEEVPSTLFDKAGEALGQCDTFQIIDKYGPSDWKLSPVSLQPVGDRTYGVRVENTTEGDTFQGGVVQVATASLGHNRVHVVHSAGPASKYHSAAVETLLKTTVDNPSRCEVAAGGRGRRRVRRRPRRLLPDPGLRG